MQVVFSSRRLLRNYRNFASASRAWGDVVARRYIQRVDLLYEIEQFHLLYTLQSLRLHQLSGQRAGQFAITLDRRWRLIISHLEEDGIIIIEEVTNHYGD